MIEGNIVALPVTLVGVAFVLLARGARLRPQTMSLGLVAIVHIGLVVALTLFPLPVQPEVIEEGRRLQYASNNWVPGASIIGGIARGGASDVLKQTLGNLLALAPIGIYGPLLWPRLRTWRGMLLAGIGASLTVETAQLLVSTAIGYTYRIADVDDVLINVACVLAGYAIYPLGRKNSVSSG